MIQIKNKAAIERMRTAGKLLANVFEELKAQSIVKAGVSTHDVDAWIEKSMRAKELKPECIGYGGYRHATCISVNDAIVHGVPSKTFILKDGDFVKVDVVGSYKGYCADMARYFFVGSIAPVTQKIADVAQESLDAALALVAPGVFLEEISGRIQQIVEGAGFGVVRQFAGHGIGKSMHEEPDVPNYAEGAPDLRLREGMTLAIEPMITEGSYDVVFSKDGWTAKTADGKLAAHVEDTVLVTAHGAEILTRL